MVCLKSATTTCVVQKEKTQTRITFNNLSANLTVNDLYKYVQLHLEEDRPFELSLVTTPPSSRAGSSNGGGGGGDSEVDLKSAQKVRRLTSYWISRSLGLCDDMDMNMTMWSDNQVSSIPGMQIARVLVSFPNGRSNLIVSFFAFRVVAVMITISVYGIVSSSTITPVALSKSVLLNYHLS